MVYTENQYQKYLRRFESPKSQNPKKLGLYPKPKNFGFWVKTQYFGFFGYKFWVYTQTFTQNLKPGFFGV